MNARRSIVLALALAALLSAPAMRLAAAQEAESHWFHAIGEVLSAHQERVPTF